MKFHVRSILAISIFIYVLDGFNFVVWDKKAITKATFFYASWVEYELIKPVVVEKAAKCIVWLCRGPKACGQYLEESRDLFGFHTLKLWWLLSCGSI